MQQGFFEYRKFEGTVGDSDLQGALTYSNAGAHPKLTGTLTSNELDFADLAPLIGADSNAAKARRQAPEVQPAGKLLPVEKFDTARWRHMDANVTFFAGRIVRKHALPIEDLSTRVRMHEGVLTLDPLKLGIAGGDLDARVTLDGRDNPMRTKALLSVRGVQLKKLMPTLDLVHTSLGHINGDATLDGTGNSIAGILGTSNGEVKLLIDNGMISKLLLEEAGLNLANIAKLKLFGDKPTRLNCAAADFIGRNGLWRSRLLVIDTQDMTIDVDGTVNLASGRLDFTLHPHNKDVRILSLRSPLYLHGTLEHPSAGVAKGPLVARSAAATALGTIAAPLAALATLVTPHHDHENACAGVLAAMRKPAQR